MEPLQRLEVSPHTPTGENGSQSTRPSNIDHMGAQSLSLASPDPRQHRPETAGLELQQPWGHAFQPEFQDSNLSPALLLPVTSGGEHNFTDYSLFQQSDQEFAPLRAYPDISMATERSHSPPRDSTIQASECGSLSQHPLAQETILSEEGTYSRCSLSQHNLSPGDNNTGKGTVQSSLIPSDTDRQGGSSSEDSNMGKKDSEMLTDPPDKSVREAAEDETFFLNKDVPAKHLLDLLQKDFGMPSSSSSAVSSISNTSVKTAASLAEEAKSTKVCQPGVVQSMFGREGPTGEVSPPQQTQKPDLFPAQSQTRSSELCNITSGCRSTQPDDSTEALHRELLSETERSNSSEAASRNREQRSTSPTPFPKERHEGKPSVAKTNPGSVPWTGPFSAGVERAHRDQDLWSSGNQTGIDGSYLGFLPQSQSTPGAFKAPHKSSVKARLGQLSDIESSQNSRQSSTGIFSHPAVPTATAQTLETAKQSQEEAASAEVQSLPSLNFMEKVDAWRANQTSGKTSLFDSLALQGFSGVSPKKKAYDAVSDTLNRILSQQTRSSQQPPVSSAANLNATQTSFTAPSATSSSSQRGEAVGSAPCDKDNTGSVVRPSASPYGRSQSHSSVSTVVMSAKKDQQTETSESSRFNPQSATVQPSPLMSLGHFSDVSLDQESTLSSSRDSHNYEMKLGTSVGASSVVSLEVDNYAPYWTSKPSTPAPPPRPRELNIEERIPLYLHNLGIHQSPSTILTPFAAKGPIREPEFSPTDLCTIKGSVGTPTKSAQPSEGGSPQKREFSRCSVLSVDSSVSVTLSLDSLGPAVSIPEQPRRTSPSSDTEAEQSERRLAASSLPDEDSYSSILQPPLHQQQRDVSLTSSQTTIQPGERLDTSRSLERSVADSFVSSQALSEIRKLLSQAENVASVASPVASLAVPRLLSDNDIFLSLRKKTSRDQEPSLSASAAGDPRTQSSLLWARSSSDSMLTSDRIRESSIGQESVTSAGQTNDPATHAAAADRRFPDNIVSGDAGLSFVLSQSARRAEPEGCSAAPPDNTAQPKPTAIIPSPPPGAAQLPSAPSDAAGVTEEETQTTPESPVQSSSSSPIPEDQGAMSDGSSESSLAVRVAKLLQNESPSTMVSRGASTTDQEETKAREWIKLKLSGQQCEPLVLDQEDRRRIEEIKRELLLKNPIKSHGSTDTESSTSSIRVSRGGGQDLPPKAQNFSSLPSDLSDPSAQPQNPPPSNLEAQVREIAAREGVTLPRTNPVALTSITIATRKRSSSSSPSTSPAPPLSPAPELLHLTELSTGAVPPAHTQPPRVEEENNLILPSAPATKKREDTVGGQLEGAPLSSQRSGGVHMNDRRDEEPSVQAGSVSGVCPEAEQITASTSPEPPARTGHVSHVHLTLSPKPDSSSSTAVQTDPTPTGHRRDFVPLRHSSSASSSLDEGVGLSSPPDWYDSRERERFKPPQGKIPSRVSQSSVSRPPTSETPAVPVLLPYKPHGSEELFYIPQTKADVSSDTTVESSHTGSDDAVPPSFSSEVLGHKDPGLDRGVTIRHTEGIYSKRLKTATFKMQEPGHRDETSPAPKPSSQVSVAFTRVPLSSNQETSRRDQGTSPVHFLSPDHSGLSRERFQPVHVDPDYSRVNRSRVPQTGKEPDQETVDSDLPAHSSSALDQLWQRFCDYQNQEKSRPTRDREASLLERLERLSHLIRSTKSDVSVDHAAGRGGARDVREVEAEHEDSRGSLTSCDSSLSSHLTPADRDESESMSTTSGSMSTVDTARLIRAFGAHRVRHLKSSSGLSKLYGAINRQKEGREQRRGGLREAASETNLTDESTITADSSTSTYTVPSQHGPSRTLKAKKAVRLVNKSIQAGDLELVSNATRRHTRDVGTTFPSPREARTARPVSSSSAGSERGRGGLEKQKQKKKKSFPHGFSWFISADELRSEARKENQPEEEEWTQRPSTAWFEPYSRTKPWREPLRQRQVQEDRETQHRLIQHADLDLDPSSKAVPSSVARISLQDALEMRRPDFISQSRQRMRSLALQAEERRLQADFSRDREELFVQPRGLGGLPRPAGTALLRRAVPRKEMIQRSKQIYQSLPEVQQRREEERRKAEYRSYRLNAQLYNKRITSRVLGRRTAWQ
ncbi:uncharacterized protein alms1 isoform X2 [Halichoeres trimaculatus]|uniref:uncharacterized protein alms1 isoform X2 n=1 Tax=Halichoeres trimaculatus TaxID=147232 RepID=UPI003D9E1EF6